MISFARFIWLWLFFVCLFVREPQSVDAFDEPMKSIKTGDVTGVYYAAGSAVAIDAQQEAPRVQSALDCRSL